MRIWSDDPLDVGSEAGLKFHEYIQSQIYQALINTVWKVCRSGECHQDENDVPAAAEKPFSSRVIYSSPSRTRIISIFHMPVISS